MFQFTLYAERKFLKFEKSVQEMLTEKLTKIRESNNFTQLTTLQNFAPATHRLRIGDYRLILQRISLTKFIVLDIGHRREIYR